MAVHGKDDTFLRRTESMKSAWLILACVFCGGLQSWLLLRPAGQRLSIPGSPKLALWGNVFHSQSCRNGPVYFLLRNEVPSFYSNEASNNVQLRFFPSVSHRDEDSVSTLLRSNIFLPAKNGFWWP